MKHVIETYLLINEVRNSFKSSIEFRLGFSKTLLTTEDGALIVVNDYSYMKQYTRFYFQIEKNAHTSYIGLAISFYLRFRRILMISSQNLGASGLMEF
jgi:hypothetical protein